MPTALNKKVIHYKLYVLFSKMSKLPAKYQGAIRYKSRFLFKP